jgi:hypothetical protein
MIAAFVPLLNVGPKTELRCRACGWVWKARKPNPVKCPSCWGVGTFFPLRTVNAAVLPALPSQEGA